jgi:phage terminase small subunit
MTHEESAKTLSPLQKRFVKEYPKDFNGTEAYLRASKSKNRKSASVQATKLMKMEKVKDAIQAYVQDQLGPHEQELLGNVKFWREIRDGKTPGDLVRIEDVLKVVGQTYEKAIKKLDKFTLDVPRPQDRLKASEMLAKYQQMFVEKKDVNMTGQVKIVEDIPKK